MVNTNISDIATRIEQNARAKNSLTGSGNVATNCYPGQYVVKVSGTWTLADSDTAAHKLIKGGVVSYRKRKNDDDGNPTIDDVYDIDNEPNLASIEVAKKGIVACFIVDQVATVDAGTGLIISSTAGSLTRASQEATGATSGTAIRSLIVATLARKVVSGDTKAFVDLDAQGADY